MNIQQQNGVVSTINFAPYFDIEEYQSLRQTLFTEAKIVSNFSPIEHTDVFDESILVFEDYFQALHFLINVFRTAVKLEEYSGVSFILRSSLCKGDYFIQQEQIYGDAVNLATRLSCTSRENELLVCGIDRQIIDEFINSQDDVSCCVRNSDENCVSICLLDEDSTQSKGDNKVFKFECNNKTSVFDLSRNQQIQIGRSNDSDVFIDSDEVSRNHATISLNYDQIFIEDHSSNGTYIYFDGREIYLANDSMEINNKGYISCGRKNDSKKGSPDIISYILCEEAKSAA
jgi:adenylate cyclase